MSRRRIHDLNRHTMNAEKDPGLAKEAALELLNRSIRFGHARLAVVRLSYAAYLGAEIDLDQYRYCLAAAKRIQDGALLQLLDQVKPPFPVKYQTKPMKAICPSNLATVVGPSFGSFAISKVRSSEGRPNV